MIIMFQATYLVSYESFGVDVGIKLFTAHYNCLFKSCNILYKLSVLRYSVMLKCIYIYLYVYGKYGRALDKQCLICFDTRTLRQAHLINPCSATYSYHPLANRVL